MFQIGKTLVSEELIQEEFTCNLSACKGECCVSGDAGAPLSKEEAKKLEAIYEKVKPFMRKEGIEAIQQQGKFVRSEFDEGELETTLVNGKECAYVSFSENGTALCSIESAYRAGKIDWKKPISCELYPVRVQKYSSFEAVNYDRWSICSDACSLGKELQQPIYKFTKAALIKKFGNEWYEELCRIAANYTTEK
ncbi:DUF3109 family protein [Psychroflexus maritimus]|uniref:DUF3109 family protein n=1 Tax=Psychroflexus maritimus TaxID=2714865 RepID=A0A967AM35_9FLAO|nr:DUF3109 family protein [Psychroflexus maritimus]NGZ90824.1 DUF3109 family protein [Psychroflexus maritimus]